MFIMTRPEQIITAVAMPEDFRIFAIKAHGEQMYDKDLGIPYSYHLAHVEHTLHYFDYNDIEYKAAAWLHDTIEDTPVQIERVTELYGADIASMVWACTGVGENRKQRNASIFARLRKVPKAAPVKVADRMANILHGIEQKNLVKLKMYLMEWPEFKKNVEPLMVTSKDRYFWAKVEDMMDEIAYYLGRDKAEEAVQTDMFSDNQE